MDASVALRRVENSLRDTLQSILSKSIGDDWIEKCGASDQRIEKWKERAAEDQKKRGSSDPRLIYYADFYDLGTIIRKSWNKGLQEVFGDLRELEVLLKILEDLRNPDAHRREFLPFESHLAEGIAGKIRSKIAAYYSKMETSDSYYPRFEFAQDSLGNSYSLGQGKSIRSQIPLRPGDLVDFKLVATDPLGGDVEFLLHPNSLSHIRRLREVEWNRSGDFSFEVTKDFVGKSFSFIAFVRSKREFHAYSQPLIGGIDDKLSFTYEVLPPRLGSTFD